MRSAALEATEFTPVFNWSPPRSRKLSLISFIAASAVLHALCFYIFQIIYPPTVALLPPPARITIITPDSEDGRVLLRWIEAEDPALSSTTQRPPNAVSLEPPRPVHVPSFAGREPPLRALPPYQPDLQVPSAHPPAPVPRPRASAVPAKVALQTKFSISDEAGVLGEPDLTAFKFSASRSEPPQPAQFRIAIGARGDVRHCFLAESSDDPALDEQAHRYLLLCRFPGIRRGDRSVDDVLLWTTATVEWGNDFATPARASNENPAP